MTPLAADLLVLFRRDLGALAREVALFPDDEALWRTVPGIANPGSNLAFQVAGNLRHFVGAVLGDTGRFLLHLTARLAFHLGQIGYLRRALTGDLQSAGAMAIPDLAQP